MNRAHKIAAAVSLAVVVLCMMGSFMTRGVMEHLPFLHGQKAGWSGTVVLRESWTSGPGRQQRRWQLGGIGGGTEFCARSRAAGGS